MKISKKIENINENLVVALDGPSAAGKGMIGRMLADEFSLNYIQSSLVYRGLAYICLQNNVDSSDVDLVTKLSASEDIINNLDGIDLNTEIIGDYASKISVYTKVRDNLGQYLQKLISTTPRIIMEGRDIGTVVAPNADLKIFITANVEVRAKRRYKQLLLEGKDCKLAEVLGLMKDRDQRDVTRLAAPLVPADDAIIIDTSDLTPVEIIQKIKGLC